ncbi:MAG: hypothetical protein EBW39_11285 [Betaproteobacteria bacterium]|nr:hypothetical protein [Betaproteobacteria bacterium]
MTIRVRADPVSKKRGPGIKPGQTPFNGRLPLREEKRAMQTKAKPRKVFYDLQLTLSRTNCL